MAEIYDLINEIRDFFLFKNMGDLLLFEGNIRSKIWTIEILTNNLNKIVDKFVQSNFKNIESFFIRHLENHFGNNLKKKKKFCYTLILSLIFFKPKNYYLTLYYNFLKNSTPKNVYEYFLKTKNIFFRKKNILTDQNFINLDQIFLKEKEWIVLLNDILDLNAREINDFKDKMTKNLRKFQKQKLPNLNQRYKNGKYSLTFFLSQCLNKYCERNDLKLKLEKKKKIQQRKISKRSTIVEGLKKDSFDVFKSESEKLKEKNILLKQIKESIKKTNIYRLSSARMMCYIKEIDSLYLSIKNLFKETKEILTIVKRNKINGKVYEDFIKKTDMGTMSFLDRGINLNNKNFKNLQKLLLNKSVEQFKVISCRVKDRITSIKILVKNLKSKIFKENFSLAQNNENRNLEKLQVDLGKIFGNFHLKNSDFIILNTFFQNYDTNNEKEMSLGNVLEKVGGKIIKMVDIVLNELDEYNESSQINNDEDITDPQYYENQINKNIDKINGDILNSERNLEDDKDFEKNINSDNSKIEKNGKNKITEINKDKDSNQNLNFMEEESRKNFKSELENRSFEEKEKSLLIAVSNNNEIKNIDGNVNNNKHHDNEEKDEIIDSDINEKNDNDDRNEMITSKANDNMANDEDKNNLIDSDSDGMNDKKINELIKSDIDENNNEKLIKSDFEEDINELTSNSGKDYYKNKLKESEVISSFQKESSKQRIDSFGVPNDFKVVEGIKNAEEEEKNKNPQNHESKSTQLNSIQKSNLINNLIDKKKNSTEESQFRYSNIRGDSAILKDNIKQSEEIVNGIDEEESDLRKSRISRKSQNSFIEKNRKSVSRNSSLSKSNSYVGIYEKKKKNLKRESKMRLSISGIGNNREKSVLGISNITPKINSEITNLNHDRKKSLNNSSSPMLNIKVNNLEKTENENKLKNSEFGEDFGKTILINTATEKGTFKNVLNSQLDFDPSLTNTKTDGVLNKNEITNSEFGKDFGKTILIQTEQHNVDDKNKKTNNIFLNPNKNEVNDLIHTEINTINSNITNKNEISKIDINKNYDESVIKPGGDDFLRESDTKFLPTNQSIDSYEKSFKKIGLNKKDLLLSMEPDDFENKNNKNILKKIEEESNSHRGTNLSNKIKTENSRSEKINDKNESEIDDDTGLENNKNFENNLGLDKTIDLNNLDDNIQLDNTIQLENDNDLESNNSFKEAAISESEKNSENKIDNENSVKEQIESEKNINDILVESKLKEAPISESEKNSKKKINNEDSVKGKIESEKNIDDTLVESKLAESKIGKRRKTLNDYLNIDIKTLSKVSNMSGIETRKSKIKPKKPSFKFSEIHGITDQKVSNLDKIIEKKKKAELKELGDRNTGMFGNEVEQKNYNSLDEEIKISEPLEGLNHEKKLTNVEDFQDFAQNLDNQNKKEKIMSKQTLKAGQSLLKSNIKLNEGDVGELENLNNRLSDSQQLKKFDDSQNNINENLLPNRVSKISENQSVENNPLITYGNTPLQSGTLIDIENNKESVQSETLIDIEKNKEIVNNKEEEVMNNEDNAKNNSDSDVQYDLNNSNFENSGINEDTDLNKYKGKFKIKRDINSKHGKALAEKTGMKEIGEKSLGKFFKGFFGNK